MQNLIQTTKELVCPWCGHISQCTYDVADVVSENYEPFDVVVVMMAVKEFTYHLECNNCQSDLRVHYTNPRFVPVEGEDYENILFDVDVRIDKGSSEQ